MVGRRLVYTFLVVTTVIAAELAAGSVMAQVEPLASEEAGAAR